MEKQEEKWYYQAKNGTQSGPATIDELRKLYKAKKISFETQVWTETQKNWQQINDLPRLKARIKPRQQSGLKTPPKESNVNKKAPPRRQSSFDTLKSGVQSVAKKRLSKKSSSQWIEKTTVDGVSYYYNSVMNKVTYEKPDELKSEEERKKVAGDWVWTRDEKEAWLPGRVLKKNGEAFTVEVKGRGTKDIIRDPKTEPLWPVALSSLNRLEDDMVLLDDLNEAMMIHDVKERYKQDNIYTWVGASQTVLVSINPFQRLPIYGIQLMNEFARPAPNKILPPHPFAVANQAYLRLRIDAHDQAMLISGESGAGKTEATKQILSFLAEIAGSHTNVEQKVLSANPVLEAFGNAKTVRNNNSSRFGRWMQVHFDERGSISSAHIENYLLEKSRVVSMANDERTYHIFYQLITAYSQYSLEKDASKHSFLYPSNCFRVKGIDDKADFLDVKRSLEQLDFDPAVEIDATFKVTAGVLRLGDIEFCAQGDGSQISSSSQQIASACATLLGISSVHALASALTNKAIEVRGARTLSPCDLDQAREGRDALAKAVFGNLFNWLVQRINQAVASTSDDDDTNGYEKEKFTSSKFIGILDIFGFEIFERNSFEQLLINYTNEKLQQHFNKFTFKQETQLYADEGISLEEPVNFIDNQPILDLIERKPDGLLLLLDDEVTAPKGSDAKWLSRCEAAHNGKSEWLSVTEKHASASGKAQFPKKNNVGEEDFFGVTHYAGDVKYLSQHFCHKNKDPVGRNLYDLMALQAPGFDIVGKHLFPPLGTNPRRQPTIAGQFRKQLTSLMKIIDAASPCYVRCIKPNHQKKPRQFETVSCIEQLRYSGVFEAVKIRKSGYPFRLSLRRFSARYRILIDTATLAKTPDLDEDAPERTRCLALLQLLKSQDLQCKIGKSMVLYRAPEHRVLELLRNLALERLVPVAQRGLRRGTGRVYRRLLRQVRKDLQTALDSPDVRNDAVALDSAIDSALSRIGPHQTLFPWLPPELEKVRERRFFLQERLDLDVVMKELLDTKSESYDGLANCVRRADAIASVPGTPAQMKLEESVRDALTAVAAKKLDPLAQAAIDVLDKALMEQIKEEAVRARYSSDDFKRIDEFLAMSDEALTKLQLKRANELDDPDRVVNREIRLKQLMLDTYAAMYQLSAYSGLRERKEWAARKSRIYSSASKRQKIAESMLKHQSNAIHCALTDPSKRMDAINGAPITKGYDKTAVLMFKCILGFMGESKHPYPESLGSEALTIALNDQNLRSEFYLQILKQLSENPSSASVEQAWQLLAAAFATFPPPPSFENFVALFLKDQSPSDKRNALISGLYAGVYGGERTNPVTADELPHLVARTLNSEISARYLDVDTVDASANFSKIQASQTKAPPPPPPVLHQT